MTGGQRLHRYEDYVAALAARGESTEPYESYLDVFRHGMPPHGGFAIGLERLLMRLTGAANVRGSDHPVPARPPTDSLLASPRASRSPAVRPAAFGAATHR